MDRLGMIMDKIASLPPDLQAIVQDKGTERPYTGQYHEYHESGTYLCRRCGLALFRSKTKFASHCGWPSFDEEIPQTVHYQTDADGRREEIVCARCQAHLGHVCSGEGFTPKHL